MKANFKERFIIESNLIEDINKPYGEEPLAPPETRDHAKAYDYALGLEVDKDITIGFINEINRLLLQNLHAQAGYIRGFSVTVGNFEPPVGSQLIIGFDDLCKRISAGPGNRTPDKWCYLMHCRFECVHPYPDGNGRTGRLLWLLLRRRLGLPDKLIEFKDRQTYYKSIRHCYAEKFRRTKWYP